MSDEKTQKKFSVQCSITTSFQITVPADSEEEAMDYVSGMSACELFEKVDPDEVEVEYADEVDENGKMVHLPVKKPTSTEGDEDE